MRKVAVLLAFLRALTPALAYNAVKLYSFCGQGCPHCVKLHSFLQDMQERYPSLEVVEYEVYFDRDNRVLLQRFAETFNKKIEGVPSVFIDEKVIVGFSDALALSLEQEIARCLVAECGDPAEIAKSKEALEIIGDKSPVESPEKTQLKRSLTLPAVVSAAAVDAINPCAFAVLIILLTAILASQSRRRALLA